ncbi:MAG: ATP-binding protein, partial [Thermodesulfovibrionales bacterium]
KSNSLPLMKVPIPYRIEEVDIRDVSKIIIYSDGLNECYSNKGELYNDHIKSDFKNSCSAKDLFAKFSDIMDNPNDDITIIFLKKLGVSPIIKKEMTIPNSLKEITLMTEHVKNIISPYLDDKEIVLFISAFSEIILNSYEHGNIELPASKKRELISQDIYDDYLLQHEGLCEKCINVRVEIFHDYEGCIVTVTVVDGGSGFDVSGLQYMEKESKKFSGRGIRIAETILDGIYYNHKGNEVTLIKKSNKGGKINGDQGNRGI